jgi:hypothetical protein
LAPNPSPYIPHATHYTLHMKPHTAHPELHPPNRECGGCEQLTDPRRVCTGTGTRPHQEMIGLGNRTAQRETISILGCTAQRETIVRP